MSGSIPAYSAGIAITTPKFQSASDHNFWLPQKGNVLVKVPLEDRGVAMIRWNLLDHTQVSGITVVAGKTLAKLKYEAVNIKLSSRCHCKYNSSEGCLGIKVESEALTMGFLGRHSIQYAFTAITACFQIILYLLAWMHNYPRMVAAKLQPLDVEKNLRGRELSSKWVGFWFSLILVWDKLDCINDN